MDSVESVEEREGVTGLGQDRKKRVESKWKESREYFVSWNVGDW